MFRFVILLCAVHLSTSHFSLFSHSNRHVFEELADAVIEVDKRLEDNCNENKNVTTTELYAPELYRLTTSVEGFTRKCFDITIKHRTLFINAFLDDDSGHKHYIDIRVIAAKINATDATWSYEAGQLVVEVPYHRDHKTCSACVNHSKVTVREAVTTGPLDVRFGNTNDDVVQNN